MIVGVRIATTRAGEDFDNEERCKAVLLRIQRSSAARFVARNTHFYLLSKNRGSPSEGASSHETLILALRPRGSLEPLIDLFDANLADGV